MPRYLIIIICFIIVLAVGLGLLWPKAAALKSLRQTLKTEEQEFIYEKSYSLDLQNASRILQENQAKLAKIDSILPDSDDALSLLNYFQTATARQGLVLKGLNVPTITSSSRIKGKEISFLLSFSGSYLSFKNFLSVLYKSARFFEAESVSISSPQKGDIFDFTMTVKTYSY